MTRERPSRPGAPRPAHTGRRTLLAATIVALAGGLVIPLGSATAQPAGAQASAPSAAAAGRHDITLVTGDVVHYLDGPGNQDVVTVGDPGDAEPNVRIQEFGDHLYVVPEKAEALLAAGRLDRRLFDIRALVEMGYDDARSGGLPLIATYADTTARSLPAAPDGSAVTRRLESIHGAALKADKRSLDTFWADVAASPKARSLGGGIAKLWLDGRVEAALKDSVPQVGAPQAWAVGYDGKGIKVAVLDTGIDPSHPDVKDHIVGSKSFVPGQEVLDKHGHGTHCASTIAGSGAASDGANKGVAPGADLLIGKVLSDSGSGADSGIIEAMEWAKAEGADVVSMSLGSSVPDDGDNPMAQAVDALSAGGGPLFVIAAGNAYAEGSIGAPGSAEKALTVAAVDKSDRRASFSSMGPLVRSYALKPDISAPGVNINAAASQAVPNTTGMYRSMSGTSMATPHVAGAAAILKQRHPDWTGQQLKDALMTTSKQLTAYTPYQMGTGRLDVKAALDSTVEATGSVAAATYDWPHAATDTAAQRTITYRNHGTADVTLNLTLDTTSAAYSLSRTSVTVPAGGTAQTVLTLDPTQVPAATTFSGQVIATNAANDAVAAHTGFALHKERELHNLTVKLLDRQGKPATGRVVLAKLGDQDPSILQLNGEQTLRLPPGNYGAWAVMDTTGDRADSLAMMFLVDPETMLDKDTTITLDASKARKISVRTPEESETRQWRYDMARTAPSGAVFREAYPIPVKYDQLWATPTEQVTEGGFSFLTRWRQGQERYDVTADDRDVPVTVQNGTPGTNGRLQLRAVYAGNGAASDYAGLDVRGKAVIVDRSDAVKPTDRVANAVAAGAKALFVVNDGAGNLLESYSASGTTAAIPVLSVRREDGRRLVDDARDGGLRLTVDQHQFAEYLYDLVSRHDGAIPDRSLAYAPDEDDLARVDSAYYGHRAALGGGYRYDLPGYGAGVGFREWESYPATRTEWVTPQTGKALWYEDHSVFQPGTSSTGLEMRGTRSAYLPGKRFRADWFAPVQRPRLGTEFWGPFRDTGGNMQFNMPAWADSGTGHAGAMPGDTESLALYRDGVLVRQGQFQSLVTFDQPAETLPYTLVQDASRDSAAWKTSVRTHTEWDFRSGKDDLTGPNKGKLRLLQLDYGVDTDLTGDTKAGTRTEVTLSAATQAWLADQAKATEATLSVSYDDGGTWTPVTLSRTADGAWKASFVTPDTPGGFVSLKATAKAEGGLGITQEVIRAFGLR
ncbi:S8 family serine peptidase [Streptomyces sp. NBC_00094]|uniref:S8 family peptidase n=1 Tax=Streptomyces sp. NBC_00094 TaxID=2903620 RepID=UPI002257BF1B|nr:S8 family serine peptidase [Streptomyces sp. NBC_00094]MCX5390561.1 S8 family serine peptidase [Streptomyces sp. NBC_00094]